ncbi:MAG: hypothetical protein CSB48_04790 [Proteobacteria bacterium]|nr:MAG: hypothetical protein CSB48_04790 [Pseudomonadota bacterium]
MKVSVLGGVAVMAAGVLLVGCGSDNDDNGSNKNVNYVSVDAVSGEKVFLDLSGGQTVAKDGSWDISYQKYKGYGLNGGDAGTGSVQGCVAMVYPGLYDADGAPVVAEFEMLTAENTLADFNKVNSESCTDFESDLLHTQIAMDDWLSAAYGPAGPSFTARDEPGNGWIISSATLDASGSPEAYGRVRVAEVNYASSPVTRQLKFAVELWNSGTQAFDTETIATDFLDFTNGRAYWDMETNSAVTENDDWELSVEAVGQSWNIQVNSGVSGEGQAHVGLIVIPEGSAFDVTDPTDLSQVYKWFNDSTDGALSKPGNFGPMQYNVHGTHDMVPTFSSYLVKDGDEVYKVQVLSNYGEDGKSASGTLYIRYEML